MPILDIQQRFRELGRIRTGEQIPTGKTYQSGKRKGEAITRPAKLPRFRLTSPRPDLIAQAAVVFGGEPREWKNPGTGGDEWEVYVEVDVLPVVIPPGEVFDQWYELWTGGGCDRRCDGTRQVLVDRKCACPADPMERQELAGKGQACKPTTRVRLMLPDVADIGIWRLESHGFHAAAELGGAAGLIEAATRQGAMIPADLRLMLREGARRPGVQRKTFYVPAITFRGTLGPVLDRLGILEAGSEMPVLLGAPSGKPAIGPGGERAALPAAGTPFAPAAVEPASLPGAPPVPPAAPRPVDPSPGPTPPAPTAGFAPPPVADRGTSGDVAAQPEPDAFDPPAHEPDEQVPAEEGGAAMTGPQMVAMLMKDAGITDRVDRIAYVSAIVGRQLATTKDLRPAEVRTVLDVLREDGWVDEYATPAMGYLPPAPQIVDTTAAESPPDPPDSPGEPPTAPSGPRRATGTPDTGPATWTGDQWRAHLRESGVKVTALLREAARLARAANTAAPGTLDDVAGSGLAEELYGFVAAQGSGT